MDFWQISELLVHKLLSQQRLCTLTWATWALLSNRTPKSQVATMPIAFQGHKLLLLLARIIQRSKKICLLQIHFSNILKQGEPFEELLRQKKNPSFQLPTFSSNCRSGHYLAQTHAGWPSKGTLLAGWFLYIKAIKACAFPLVIAVLWQPITVSVHALTMLFTNTLFQSAIFSLSM